MALYNEIQSGRFNRALQKLMGIKGGAPVKQLGSEIMPMVQFLMGNEFRYLESWQRFGLSFVAAANTGNSAVRFRNPAGSNEVAVLESLVITTLAGEVNQFNLEGPAPQTLDLTNSITSAATRIDARGQQNTAMSISWNNLSALSSMANTIASIIMTASTQYQYITFEDQEITVLPGDALQLRSPQVNFQILGYVWWRERFLEDAERF